MFRIRESESFQAVPARDPDLGGPSVRHIRAALASSRLQPSEAEAVERALGDLQVATGDILVGPGGTMFRIVERENGVHQAAPAPAPARRSAAFTRFHGVRVLAVDAFETVDVLADFLTFLAYEATGVAVPAGDEGALRAAIERAQPAAIVFGPSLSPPAALVAWCREQRRAAIAIAAAPVDGVPRIPMPVASDKVAAVVDAALADSGALPTRR